MVETHPLCYGLIGEANGTNWIFALSYSKFYPNTQNVSTWDISGRNKTYVPTVFLEPRLKTEFTAEAKGHVELERVSIDSPCL